MKIGKILNLFRRKKPEIYCAIGDITVKKLLSKRIYPRRIIIDGHTHNNQPVEIKIPKLYSKVDFEFRGRYNGSIDKHLKKLMESSNYVCIYVRGQEDHLIHGAIENTPLGAKLVSAEGEVIVSEKLKRHARHEKKYHRSLYGTDLWRKYGRRYMRKR